MTHEEKIARWLAPLEAARGIGVEIGAFKTPIPGLKPIYVDRFKEFAGERCLADFFGDATNLPFHDNSLDYVVTSHVLEHVANPIAALVEWYRVLRPGGMIYLVVPDRRYTWDHARSLTPVTHMLDDYERDTTPADPTHIEDFVDGVDWSTYSPGTPPAEVPAKKAELKNIYRDTVARGAEINIHFHVFEPANLTALVSKLTTWPRTSLRWQLVDQAERFPSTNPNGFLCVIRVDKTWRDLAAARWFRFRRGGQPRSVLLPHAKPFAESAA